MAKAAIFVAAFVFLLGLVSCSCNCEDDNPELKGLNDRAAQGDVKAMVALYIRYSTVEKIPPLADYWLFLGAIAGDPVLREKYVADYRASYSPEIRSRQLQALREKPLTPNSSCLLAILENDSREVSCPTAPPI